MRGLMLMSFDAMALEASSALAITASIQKAGILPLNLLISSVRRN